MPFMINSGCHHAARSTFCALTGLLQHIISNAVAGHMDCACTFAWWQVACRGLPVQSGNALAAQQLPHQRPPGMQQHCTKSSRRYYRAGLQHKS